ncbi:MAG TPA: nucleoside-triphosphatase [Nitrospiraceae bacterium]|nr:nucleoside-triphosphatase [Nitrospiraceae bacterium]
MSHMLLTGLPGVGKTTLIRELAKRLADYHPAGFFTEEIREEGVRKGFRLMSLDGRQLTTLAHSIHKGHYRVGRYGVDVDGFERLLPELNLRRSPSRMIIIDEIGKMECLSRRFTDEVLALLDSSKTVIATIAFKGDGFIRQVKHRSDCRLITVTRETRNSLADSLFTEVLKQIRTGDSR